MDMFPALEISADMKKRAFYVLDTQRRGKGMVYVPANQLIDLCLAFESAAKGEVENLEYSLKVQRERADKAQGILDAIAAISSPDGNVWNLATTFI